MTSTATTIEAARKTTTATVLAYASIKPARAGIATTIATAVAYHKATFRSYGVTTAEEQDIYRCSWQRVFIRGGVGVASALDLLEGVR